MNTFKIILVIVLTAIITFVAMTGYNARGLIGITMTFPFIFVVALGYGIGKE